MLPHTPFPHSSYADGGLQPRTPYTPYTAFQSKQNPFFLPNDAEANSNLYLLDDFDNPLASLYNKILRFVDRDLKAIMEAAERVSVKRPQLLGTSLYKGPKPTVTAVSSEETEARVGSGFDIFADVVWDSIARAIMDDLGSVVFAAGKPDEFRKVRLA